MLRSSVLLLPNAGHPISLCYSQPELLRAAHEQHPLALLAIQRLDHSLSTTYQPAAAAAAAAAAGHSNTAHMSM
jgi:hypothetical protein